jgi:hypothetical protein
MTDKADFLDISDLETRLHTDHADELRLWLRLHAID